MTTFREEWDRQSAEWDEVVNRLLTELRSTFAGRLIAPFVAARYARKRRSYSRRIRRHIPWFTG